MQHKFIYKVRYTVEWRKFKDGQPHGATQDWDGEQTVNVAGGPEALEVVKTARKAALAASNGFWDMNEKEKRTGYRWKPVEFHLLGINQGEEILV